MKNENHSGRGRKAPNGTSARPNLITELMLQANLHLFLFVHSPRRPDTKIQNYMSSFLPTAGNNIPHSFTSLTMNSRHFLPHVIVLHCDSYLLYITIHIIFFEVQVKQY